MMDLDLLRTELTRDEGKRTHLYRDSVGKWTVGVGRNLSDRGLSDDEIAFLLNNDITIAITDLDRVTPWWRGETETRQRAMANLMFNLGAPTFLTFRRFLSAMQRADYEAAAAELLDSRWADQVGSRAHRIADLIRKG